MLSIQRIAIITACTMSIMSCSLTLPVRGQSQNGSETFSGSATGYLSGSGVLTLESSTGAVCSGSFVYITSRQGEGIFNCDDGRSGPFDFVSTGSRGTGKGVINGIPITFSFGN